MGAHQVSIGIIVYSHTGHTRSVVARLHDALVAAGHHVTLEPLETVRPLQMGDTSAELRDVPDVGTYDVLVLACPVRGGTPAPPMRVYLEQLPTLEGKEVVCLVTGVMPANWGHEQALVQMGEMCQAKGAQVLASDSIRWSSLRRGRRIAEVVDRLTGLF